MKSRTQLHIATYWIFTIQKLVRKQMFIWYDLTTVSWLYVLTVYVLFRVLFVYFICCIALLFTVHLSATDTLFNKCNLLTYLLSVASVCRLSSSLYGMYDLCLEVVSRSCQLLRHIRHWISRKPLVIGAFWFQKIPIGNCLHGITWQMTSRDPEWVKLVTPIRSERNISKTSAGDAMLFRSNC